jgi:hypothetical protein
VIAARALALFALTAPLALVACGGSSSETPWPVEPVNADMGPAGESSARPAANEPGAPAPSGEAPKRVPAAKPAKP